MDGINSGSVSPECLPSLGSGWGDCLSEERFSVGPLPSGAPRDGALPTSPSTPREKRAAPRTVSRVVSEHAAFVIMRPDAFEISEPSLRILSETPQEEKCSVLLQGEDGKGGFPVTSGNVRGHCHVTVTELRQNPASP